MSRQVTMTTAEFQAMQQAGNLQRYVEQQEEADDRPEAVLLNYIRTLAKRHAWDGFYTWNARGPHQGLEGMLMRGTEVLFIHITTPHKKLTMEQQTWHDRIKRTGKLELHIWRAQDRAIIEERLTRKEA